MSSSGLPLVALCALPGSWIRTRPGSPPGDEYSSCYNYFLMPGGLRVRTLRGLLLSTCSRLRLEDRTC